MKNKILCVILIACCMFMTIGCSDTNKDKETTELTTETTMETTETFVTEEDVVKDVVTPLPSAIDLDNLENYTLSVYFEKSDVLVNETGEKQIRVIVFDYELFDMADMDNLKEGDKILLYGEEIMVKTLERKELGNIVINGGLDVGGYELVTDGTGVYYETGYSDLKAYYELGEVTLPVSPDFVFVDALDLDKEPDIYKGDDFFEEDNGIIYRFNPDNTSIVVVNGIIMSMNRIYTP